jgi:hypothetical protein
VAAAAPLMADLEVLVRLFGEQSIEVQWQAAAILRGFLPA